MNNFGDQPFETATNEKKSVLFDVSQMKFGYNTARQSNMESQTRDRYNVFESIDTE